MYHWCFFIQKSDVNDHISTYKPSVRIANNSDATNGEGFEDEVDPNDKHQRKREVKNDLEKVCIQN